MKRIIVTLFGLSSVMALQAAPEQSIMPFKWLRHPPRHVIKAQTSFSNENYADFTGEWVGHCRVKEGDVEKVTTDEHFHLENNTHWIKIFDDDTFYEYEIGKSLSDHEEDETGFSVEHLTFNWLNHTTLLFNVVTIENNTYSDEAPSINSTAARISWTLKKNNSLIIQSEAIELENNEDSVHIISTCEFVRQ